MNNGLVKKEETFFSKITKWIKNTWHTVHNNGFKQLTQSNLTEYGRVFETENRFGKKYLFKPAKNRRMQSESFRADIQEAMYNIQQKLNPNGSIPCYTTTIDGIYGAVQDKIDINTDFDILKWQLHGGKIPQSVLDGILKEYIVDWVSGNFDANGSHFLIDTVGNVRCCDKEQAFKYLFDEESQRPNLYYNPNSYIGEIEPIYNTIFLRFITGELENINLDIIHEGIEKLNSIPDEEYLTIFKNYVQKLAGIDEDKYFDAILERKHNASLYIEEFIDDILKRRDEYNRNYNIAQSDSLSNEMEVSTQIEALQEETLNSKNVNSIIGDSQQNINDSSITLDFQLEIDDESNVEQSKSETTKKIAQYGITQEEWNEIEKYKGSEYFLPSTLLHRIDLFKYNMPSYGSVFENANWLDPKKALDSYCKIYSAMCKFSKRYNKEVNINRVSSKLFYDEMSQTGQTASMLSFSKDVYHLSFGNDKDNVVLLNGTLKKGIPCIIFSEITGEDVEDEVLVPPFLNISYENNETLVYNQYPEYNVNISTNIFQKLSKEEKDKMILLEQSIKNSNIPYEYYMHWYNTIRSNPSHQGNDEKSIELKKEFFEWQDVFKEYLQLRFREIQYEINHPQLKPADFLSWGIERGQRRISSFKEKTKQIKNIFKEIHNPSKDDKEER